MKACLVGATWDAGVGNVYGQQAKKSRSVRGFTAWRTNPNFSLPPLLIPHLVAAFLGKEEARAFLQSFDRATFAAEIAAEFPELIDADDGVYLAAGGRVDMWNTYRQNWTVGMLPNMIGPGPTKAQLEACVRSYVDYEHGCDIMTPAPVFRGQIERFFSKTIRPGLVNAGNAAEPWGIFNTARTPNYWAGRMVDRTRWASLPYLGEVGAPFELDSSDEGGKRSSMGYAHDGLAALFNALLCAAVYDMFDFSSSYFATGRERIMRGMAAVEYMLAGDGYQDYAKGGNKTNNNLWTWDGKKNSERLIAMYGPYKDVVAPWGAG